VPFQGNIWHPQLNNDVSMIPTLEITTYQFPYVLEVLATIAWATSGALVARAQGFDFLGVFIIALVSTTGGGLIRDGVFLQKIPVMLTVPLYMVISFFASVVISLFGRYWEKVKRGDVVIGLIDAIGTPAFALIGFQLSYLAGIPVIGSLFVGLVNGVAGGIARDLFVGTVPRFFRPGQYFSPILIASLLLYVALLAYGRMDSNAAAWVAILFAAIARVLVIRYNWQSRPVNEWNVDEKLQVIPQYISRTARLPMKKRFSTRKAHPSGLEKNDD
jgi:uncharacterized membrane protein YeiH